MNKLDSLIAAAEADAMTTRTLTRTDGSTVQLVKGYGIATDGPFQVYLVPVEQRTRLMRPHFRATFYLLDAAGEYKRTTRAAFMAAIAEVA